MTEQQAGVEHVRVAVVGSGFAGLAAAYRLKQRGLSFLVLERASDLGGTWRDNRYPGCRCDVPSHLYSFSFAPNPNWSEAYSPQSEIEEYLRSVADRFDLRRHIRFDTAVREMTWDDDTNHWRLYTSRGDFTADSLILANGPLSEPAIPDLPGLDQFEGTLMHSARWDPSVDVTGTRVAVVGTGASAIQIVPEIQPMVEHLDLYQRTAGWVIPHNNRRLSDRERMWYRRLPILQRLMRGAIYSGRELLAVVMTKRPELSRFLDRVGRRHLARAIADPELRRKLTPTFSPGCKRLMPSNRYLPAVAKPNVELVTASIVSIDAHSVTDAEGRTRDTDILILATGFRVLDNPIMEFVIGRNGVSLGKFFSDGGFRAHWGTTIPGFPNLFMLAGPNTGIGHTSLVVMIEAQLRYVMGALDALYRHQAATLEVRSEPFERYNAEVQRKMARTIWTTGGCTSWYLDKHGRNPTLWPDFTFKFLLGTRRFDEDNYEFGAASVASKGGKP